MKTIIFAGATDVCPFCRGRIAQNQEIFLRPLMLEPTVSHSLLELVRALDRLPAHLVPVQTGCQ